MAIDYTIPGASTLDQLSEPTIDGQPDENASDNCVPASIAEGLRILTGLAYDGDQLKDSVYGQGWRGFQSASAYVSYCAARGIQLAAHNDSQAGLIAALHRNVDAGRPCLVTMPSNWNTAPADPVHPSGTTHVGIAVGTGPGELRVMNPWHGFLQDQSDAWWQARLCEGQIWPMQRGANMIPNGWHDDGTTLTAPNGVPVVHGIRAFVLAEGHDPADYPVAAEFGVPLVEYGNQALGAGVVQFFSRSGQISWTQARGTFRSWNGQEEYALRQILSNTLDALKQAQNAPAPAPAPAPLTPQQQSDLAAMAALRAAGL